MQNKNLIVIALLGLAFYSYSQQSSGGNTPAAPGHPGGIETITRMAAGVQDKSSVANLAAAYDALAGIVERDREVIKTTEQFAKLHRDSIVLLSQQTEMKIDFQGFGRLADQALLAGVFPGKTTVPNEVINESIRSRLVETLRKIAASLREGL